MPRVIRSNLVVPKRFSALTFGERIFVKRGVTITRRLLLHEAMHILQYRRYGIPGFIVRYFWGWVMAGFDYYNNPMEEEARNHKFKARVIVRELEHELDA